MTSKSNTASLNEEFFKKPSSKSKSSDVTIDFVVDKPLNASQMRQYVRDYFSQYAWDPVIMENNCVPKGGKQLGGATIMNYTPTQAFVSNFFYTTESIKGYVALA